MRQPQDAGFGKQLLVEGSDARHFFEALVRHMRLSGSIQIQDFGGVNELRGFLSAFVRMPGFGETVRSVGIVRDAEGNAGGAFRSVQSSLRDNNLSVPDSPVRRTDGTPAVSVLILPGGDRVGMLETLLCETFAGSPKDRCITAFLECVGAPAARPDKARAHAWLATQAEPHLSVGYAAQRSYWDLDHEALGGVQGFLSAL